ncbi:hypothetical protein P7K49_018026 [Saguinus oedipus]|uniref:Uncharacterized protein n=1 Tax=Saguinus oedipus TaxID=9490 RepID=A0ABQ9V4V1_SAGOE|nr:hypothetical protein P7K49_018026 [Saguinus oedipus]
MAPERLRSRALSAFKLRGLLLRGGEREEPGPDRRVGQRDAPRRLSACRERA